MATLYDERMQIPPNNRIDSGSVLDDYSANRIPVNKALLKGSAPPQAAPSKLRSPSIVDLRSPHQSEQQLMDIDQKLAVLLNDEPSARGTRGGGGLNDPPSPGGSPRGGGRSLNPTDPAYAYDYTDDEDDGGNRNGPPMYENLQKRLAATSAGAPGKRVIGAKTLGGAMRSSPSQDSVSQNQPRKRSTPNGALFKTSTTSAMQSALQNRNNDVMRRHADAKARLGQRNQLSTGSISGMVSPTPGDRSGPNSSRQPAGGNIADGSPDEIRAFLSQFTGVRGNNATLPSNNSRSVSPNSNPKGRPPRKSAGDESEARRKQVDQEEEDDDAGGGKVVNTGDADNMVLLQQNLEDTRREIEEEQKRRLRAEAEVERLRAIEVEFARLKESAQLNAESSEAERKREMEMNMLRRQAQYNEQKIKDLKDELTKKQKEYDTFVEDHKNQIAGQEQLQRTLQQREYVIGELCQEIERAKREMLESKFKEIDAQLQALAGRGGDAGTNTGLLRPTGSPRGSVTRKGETAELEDKLRLEMAKSLEAAKQEVITKAMKEIQDNPDAYFPGNGGCCGSRKQKEGKKSTGGFWSCGGR